tara:strand:- start:356 stop:607 length:252 start_codon:yes stop_codon:yes gene_type:complete
MGTLIQLAASPYLPRLLGCQIIEVTTGEPTRSETDVLSEATATRELLLTRSQGETDLWVMSAVLEGNLDCLVGEAGPIRFTDD